jgi:bifunctional polynucleotide phosphatase/kinase
MYRACYAPPGEPERNLLPLSAFGSYASAYERPEEDEGFEELRTVNFVWEGSEEQRRLWERYMLEVKR